MALLDLTMLLRLQLLSLRQLQGRHAQRCLDARYAVRHLLFGDCLKGLQWLSETVGGCRLRETTPHGLHRLHGNWARCCGLHRLRYSCRHFCGRLQRRELLARQYTVVVLVEGREEAWTRRAKVWTGKAGRLDRRLRLVADYLRRDRSKRLRTHSVHHRSAVGVRRIAVQDSGRQSVKRCTTTRRTSGWPGRDAAHCGHRHWRPRYGHGQPLHRRCRIAPHHLGRPQMSAVLEAPRRACRIRDWVRFRAGRRNGLRRTGQLGPQTLELPAQFPQSVLCEPSCVRPSCFDGGRSLCVEQRRWRRGAPERNARAWTRDHVGAAPVESGL
mmetsp:Transcript_60581/g.169233  ORF Transcript_60581/g.169233 Transcript_60581/m.169233 type:complete len:327 (-) Transcript_60581:1596-2576(-)